MKLGSILSPDGRECAMIEISAAGSLTQVETGTECKLLTVLTTAKTYEDIDDLLDLVEEHYLWERFTLPYLINKTH